MNDDIKSSLHSFVMLSGREFASGQTECRDGKVSIGLHVHVAGKEFEDVQNELATHVGKGSVLAQATMPVSIVPVEENDSPADVLTRLARSSGLLQNNIRVALLDPRSGAVIRPGTSLKGCVAVGASKMLLGKRMAELSALGCKNVTLSIRLINALGAIRAGMEAQAIEEPVLCASILPAATQLFIVSKGGIRDIGPVEHGYASILMQIMTVLNLKFEGSAARLFFGNIFDFSEHGDGLAMPLAAKIRSRLEATGEKPKRMIISGLPPMRTRMFTGHVAKALEMQPLELPLDVSAMEGEGLPSLPAVGAPSVTHMIRNASMPEERRSFFVNYSDDEVELAEYWKPTATPASQPIAAPEPQKTRMYRGVLVNDDPISEPALPPTLPIHQPVMASAPTVETKPPQRRIVRMYRGTPVYADDDVPAPASNTPPPAESASTSKVKEEEETVHIYRGVIFKSRKPVQKV